MKKASSLSLSAFIAILSLSSPLAGLAQTPASECVEQQEIGANGTTTTELYCTSYPGETWNSDTWEITDRPSVTAYKSADGTAPVIYAPTVSNLTPTSATVTWLTDQFAISEIMLSPGSSVDPFNPQTRVLFTEDYSDIQSFTIQDLTPGTKYYYKIYSSDDKGNISTVSERSFTTPQN